MSDEAKSNKVVIAEDDPAIIELLSDELRQQGFQPLVLRGGSVVKTVKDEKPGVVILDLALPDKDGTQILRELKDDWDAKKTPVIVISAYTGRLDHKGREQAEAIFPKPFDLDLLLGSVRTAINRPKD